MNDSLLHPPNINSMTDMVIGAVVARRSQSRTHISDEMNAPIVLQPSHPCTQQSAATPPSLRSFAPPALTATVQGPDSAHDNDTAFNRLSIAERGLLLQRQRRRRTQQRYRKKSHDKRLTLEDTVNQLQNEIQRLEQMLCQPQRAIENTTSWKVVVEFYRLFRHGLDAPASVFNDIATPLCLGDDHVQKRFLLRSMVPDVDINGSCGVDAVLEGWRFRSFHYGNIDLQLRCLELGAGDVVVAYMDVVTTITISMLRKSLSHLDTGDADSKWPLIAGKLHGQRLVVPSRVSFSWDATKTRFVSGYYEEDLMTQLIKLLGNLEDALIVLNSNLQIC